MKKELFKRMLKKYDNTKNKYDNPIVEIVFRSLYIEVEIDFEENYFGIVFKEDDNFIIDIIKNFKLKELYNYNNLMEIKNKYVTELKRRLKEEKNEEKFIELYKIFIGNVSQEELEIESLCNFQKIFVFNVLSFNEDLINDLDRRKNNGYFIKLLNSIDLKEVKDSEQSILIKRNLNLYKKIINENWQKKEIINYLEKNQNNKIEKIIEENIYCYFYLEKKENKECLFEKLKEVIESLNKSNSKRINGQLESWLSLLIKEEINNNSVTKLLQFSDKVKSLIIEIIYRKGKENYKIYLKKIIALIEIDKLEISEEIKEFIRLDKELSNF